MSRTDFEIKVLGVLDSSKPGDIFTYGELAQEAGYPGAARAVGNCLRNCGADHPWWRVVSSAGRLHPHGALEQAARLRLEGHTTANGKLRK